MFQASMVTWDKCIMDNSDASSQSSNCIGGLESKNIVNIIFIC